MLMLDRVAKSYQGAVALAPLSLEVMEGERAAVLGPSGSGKTTLLHLLGGVIKPDEGSIALHGKNLAAMGPGRELASLVGVMHQQLDLVPHLPVVHNIMAGRLAGTLEPVVLPGLPGVGQRETSCPGCSREGGNPKEAPREDVPPFWR